MKANLKAPHPILLALIALAIYPAATRADILYVANGSDDTIAKFTPGGAGPVFASTGLNVPFSPAFDSTGNLYAANFGDDTIAKFTPGGAGSVFASTGLNHPAGLAFDSTGNLYAANNLTNTIV